MAFTLESALGQFARMSVLLKIIIVNVAVFLLLRLTFIATGLAGEQGWFASLLSSLALSGDPLQLLVRPWTVVTYMFTQFEVTHILFNMLWLYWFGTIFLQVMPSRRVLPLYLYGGLAGAIFFIVAGLTMPFPGTLIGSSAAVIAIVAATAMIVPDYPVRLLFIGEIKLKWIAIVTIGIDLLGLNGSNVGGHIAHLGGAVAGIAFALALRRGTDITRPVAGAIDALGATFSRRRPASPPRRPASSPGQACDPTTSRPRPDMAEIDRILDKIKHSGYTSLTPEERQTLFSAGSNSKQ